MIYILLLQATVIVGILGPTEYQLSECINAAQEIKEKSVIFSGLDVVCYESNHKPNLGDSHPHVISRK
jgi:hypothetical protein